MTDRRHHDTVTLLPQNRPLTVADLAAMPDDGHRYELIDGTLIVTPAPSTRHQWVLSRLFAQLIGSCPPDLMVFTATFDVTFDTLTVVQPDLVVARRTDLTDQGLTGPPLLAVEILSPSTRLVDLNLKRARLEAAGCSSYWVVDPDVPAVTAWQLKGESYVELGHVIGEGQLLVEMPYPLAVTPARLLD